MKNSVLALAIAAGMLVTFFYLERAFRTGDSRRAIQAVQNSHMTPGGPTILQDLLGEFGADATINWFGHTENNFRGIILVTAELPDKTTRQWEVDLLNATVKPHRPASR